MAAEDHLSGQFDSHPHFQELQRNRAVQIGQRRYPAVWSMQYEGGGHASIPMENGNLVNVEHNPYGGGGYAINEESSTGLRRDEGDHYEVTHPHEVHATLDRLAQKKLSPEHIDRNRKMLKAHLDMNAESGGAY